MQNKLVVGLAAGAMAVVGVGTATAVTYHSGWPTSSSTNVESAASAKAPASSHAASGSTATATAPPSTIAPTTTAAAKTAPVASPATTKAAAVKVIAAKTVGTKAPATKPVVAAATTTVAPSVVYTVKVGDTLSGIAAWFAQHGYQGVYQANVAVIGANPNLILPGEHITIAHGMMITSTR